uniref:Uncharacterized protein n=1 Tax=Sarcophilus harrisii TaxID=9305 RepID=A0A7N4UXS7_SARHA
NTGSGYDLSFGKGTKLTVYP